MKTHDRASHVRWLLVGIVLWPSLAVIAFMTRNAHATPSTVMWAPSTPYVQSYGVMHVTYDTYFGSSAIYPIDTGLTIGVLPGEKLQAEVGFDLFYSTIAGGGGRGGAVCPQRQGRRSRGCPLQGPAGVVGRDLRRRIRRGCQRRQRPLFHAGQVLREQWYATVGVYYGMNEDLFRSSTGDAERFGFLAGWTSPAVDVPLIDRLVFCADVQTGNNMLGGAGAAVSAYFTPSIALLTGPVFFFEEELQPGGASRMWSVQLDVDLDLKSE